MQLTKRWYQRLFLTLTLACLLFIGVCLKVKAESQLSELFRYRPKLVINQAGYQLDWAKTALLLNATSADQRAELVDLVSQKPVMTILPGKPIKDKGSGDTVTTLDFSSFKQAGRYYLRFGRLRSYSFDIGQDVYQAPLVKLLRSYYLQRCGVELNDPLTGIHHPPCHLRDGAIAHSDAFHRAGKQIAAQGGWHDAGDYGKYVATTTVSIGRLLSLYEQYPNLFKDEQLAIPESGNGIPDLLDEIKVGLDWLLTMQRQDGAVYRKLSGKKWPDAIPPQQDKQRRFIYGISTPETAKFAATMAMAARIYTQQPQLAQTYLNAAQLAWQFLQAEPEMKVNWFAEDDSGSGTYLLSEIDQEEDLKTDVDDRVWAAAELYITTGNSTFEQYFTQHLNTSPLNLFEWKDPSALGMIDYLLHQQSQPASKVTEKIASKLYQQANFFQQQVANSGYRLANQRFVWGSNKMAAEAGIIMLYAYHFTKNPAQLQAAIDQLDYLLGRNHFNQSFVTGVGSKSVRHLNHLFARAQKIEIPGLLVGGSNTYAEDNIAPKQRGQLSYLDDERSYATNEYAVDYNASLIGLLGMLLGETAN